MMVEYVVWGLITLVLNATNTALTRARSSGSFKYHITVSAFAGLVWLCNQLFAIHILTDVWASKAWLLFGLISMFYMVLTVVGSVGMHYLLMHYVERGSSQVGARIKWTKPETN